jgi:hypothetical protein
MITRSGHHTVPKIFIGDHHIGGYDEWEALEATGELDELLGPVAAPTPVQPTQPIRGTANVYALRRDYHRRRQHRVWRLGARPRSRQADRIHRGS